MPKAKSEQPKQDELDRLAEGDPREVIALMLWKMRHRNPGMSMQLTLEDARKLDACCTYMGVKPAALIKRPAGYPGSPGRAPSGKDPGAAPVPAEPPRPFVVVALVNRGTEDVIRPVENNEADAQLADEARETQAAVRRAEQLAQTLLAEVSEGTFSSSTMQDAAATLRVLAKALR